MRFDVTVATLEHEVDPAVVFVGLYGSGTGATRSPHAFWLDSGLVDEGLARFSFLGDASGPHAETITHRIGGAPSIFDLLEERLAAHEIEAPELPFDFVGGYVGYFGYELKAECGGAAVHRSRTPDAFWLFADRIIAIDHHEHRTYAVALHPRGDAGAARAWVDGTLRRVADLRPRLPRMGREAPAPPAFTDAPDVRKTYLENVEACLDELRRGESYEINLTRRIHLPPLPNPLDYHLTLRALNPAPFGAFLRMGDTAVSSSSPERFLRISRDREVESKPIKGTARRGATPEADRELRRRLTEDPKTRAENLMIVDLLRNDLGRVCEPGSIEVPKFLAVETAATLHNLVSTVRGRLRSDVGPVACVRACFPGGSMTGAPKIRTMEIIDELETEARGVYSGALGYLSLNGAVDLNIVIRTAVMTPHDFSIGAGGAIVLDSVPEEEYDEMLLKARALLQAYEMTYARRP